MTKNYRETLGFERTPIVTFFAPTIGVQFSFFKNQSMFSLSESMMIINYPTCHVVSLPHLDRMSDTMMIIKHPFLTSFLLQLFFKSF